MTLTFTIPVAALADVLPTPAEFAQAAGRGVSNKVKRHLVDRDAQSGRADGMPRTGYYGDAANSVTTEVVASRATVTIHKEGVALHYYGGVVYPTAGHKALAIPKSPATAGKRPAEFDPSHEKLALVWPKGSSTGTLRDKKSGDVFYLLVAHANIPADESVIPEETALGEAAIAAMESII